LASLDQMAGKTLVLFPELFELLALQYVEFGVFERGRIVEAGHLRQESHAAEEVAASVGQRMMACLPRRRSAG
jgi:hypothetical protein